MNNTDQVMQEYPDYNRAKCAKIAAYRVVIQSLQEQLPVLKGFDNSMAQACRTLINSNKEKLRKLGASALPELETQ